MKCPCPLLLFGEYSALEEQPTIAISIPLYIELGLKRTDTPGISYEFSIPPAQLDYRGLKRFVSRKKPEFKQPREDIREKMESVSAVLSSKIPKGRGLRVEAIYGIPSMCGLGSSGALCAALSMAIYVLRNDVSQKDLNEMLNRDLQQVITDRRFDEMFRFAWSLEDIFHEESSGVAPFVSLVGSKDGLPLIYFSNAKGKTKRYHAMRFSELKGVKGESAKELREFFWKECNPTVLHSGSQRDNLTSGNVKRTMDRIEKRVDLGVLRLHDAIAKIPCDRNASRVISKILGPRQPAKEYILNGLWNTYGLISLITISNLLSMDTRDIKNMMHTAQDLLSFLELSTRAIDAISVMAKNRDIGCKIIGSGGGGDVLLIGEDESISRLVRKVKEELGPGSPCVHFRSNKISPEEQCVTHSTVVYLKKIKTIGIVHEALETTSRSPSRIKGAIVPLHTTEKQLDPSTGGFRKKELENRKGEIERSLEECIGKGADVVIYPELSVPKEAIDLISSRAARDGKLVVIAGSHIHIEKIEKNEIWFNRCPIITPTQIIYQDKIHKSPFDYPLVKEVDQLKFITGSRIGNFCVNICSGLRLDISDLKTSRTRRERLDFMFVPSLNRDLKVLRGDLEKCCYDYYTHIVVANTSEFGGSEVWGPFHSERRRFSLEKGQEGLLLFEIDSQEFSEAWKGKKSKEYKTPDK